jgi:hypothetical protein
MSKLFSLLATSLTLLVVAAAPVAAAPNSKGKPGGGGDGGSTSSTLLGNDVSWPQCGGSLPTGQAFGIVGVNGGLANTDNPCLAEQLAWAATSTGGTGQPKVALYVNTANPGHEGKWWPDSNEYGGQPVSSEYGTCTGANDQACAYVYGYAKAYDNVSTRVTDNPGGYLWWLDIETINTWQADKVANRAAMEGMTAYYQSIGASVGLYSTSYQFGQIIGDVPSTSNLYNLPSWLAGARNQKDAVAKCSSAPLTAGGKVTMTQFVSKSLDYDYSCI